MESKSIHLTLDGQSVCAAPGTTIHAAAAAAGIRIPTLCWKPGFHAGGSCMICAVEAVGRPGLIPSCAAVVEEGLQIRTATEAVRAARRTAVELLLSDHAGDCEGLCRRACPADLDIPAMIRLIAEGRMREAVTTVWEAIPFPAILGRICPAPCERACRRGAVDEPVSICLLKRRVGDWALAQEPPGDPVCRPPTGRKVAVIGAGPAGLAAAFELLRAGHACALFDEQEEAGGGWCDPELHARLPREILRAEVARLDRMGATWRLGRRVEGWTGLEKIRAEFDAVILAPGPSRQGEWSGPEWPRVFPAGGGPATRRMSVRAVAEGRRAAGSAIRCLAGGALSDSTPDYSHQAGRLTEAELQVLLSGADAVGRQMPAGDGYSEVEAAREAGRCLRCDCRRKNDCRLRELAGALAARPARFKGRRRAWTVDRSHPRLTVEPGKCIACGLCIQISRRPGMATDGGLTFWGRGLGMETRPPWGRDWGQVLTGDPAEYVAACPTGALSWANPPAQLPGDA